MWYRMTPPKKKKKKKHRRDYLKIVGDLTAVEHITGCRSTTGVEELWRLVIRIQNVNGQHAGAVQSSYVLSEQDKLLERCVTGQRAGDVQSSYVLNEQDTSLERLKSSSIIMSCVRKPW